MLHIRLAGRLWMGVVAGLVLLSQPAAADDDKDNKDNKDHVDGRLAISSAFADQDRELLTIRGFNLAHHSAPKVTLGGLELEVSSFSPTELLALLPADFPAGSYRLIVRRSHERKGIGTLDVTVGTVGPRGPVGPEGPEGKLPAVMCPAGQALRGINADGTPECFAVVLPPVQVIAIDIRKQEEGPDSRAFTSGSAVPFTIVITNTGTTELANVSVSDPVTPVCNNTIGALSAGVSVTYTCTVPNVTTNLATVATVTGSHNGVTVTDSDPSNVEVVVQVIAIDIRKQAEGPDSRTFPSGSAVPFTIVITNTGTTELANVSVSDPVTPVCNNTIGALSAGVPVTYTCTVPNVTTNLATVATVTGSHNGVTVTDSDPSNVVIIVTP